jgi:hypothetical protein
MQKAKKHNHAINDVTVHAAPLETLSAGQNGVS